MTRPVKALRLEPRSGKILGSGSSMKRQPSGVMMLLLTKPEASVSRRTASTKSSQAKLIPYSAHASKYFSSSK